MRASCFSPFPVCGKGGMGRSSIDSLLPNPPPPAGEGVQNATRCTPPSPEIANAHGEPRTSLVAPPAGVSLAGADGDLDPAPRDRCGPCNRQPVDGVRLALAGRRARRVGALQRLRPLGPGLRDPVRLELV